MLSIILCAAMVCLMLPVTAFGDEPPKASKITLSATSGGNDASFTATLTDDEGYAIVGKKIAVKEDSTEIAYGLSDGEGKVIFAFDTSKMINVLHVLTVLFEGDDDYEASPNYRFDLTVTNGYDFLSVNGIDVTPDNRDNILNDVGTPSAVFDQASKTLTLTDYDGGAIYGGIGNLIIDLKGSLNKISVGSTENYDGIRNSGYYTIQGNADLEINQASPYENCHGINAPGGVLIDMNGNLSIKTSKNDAIHLTYDNLKIAGNGNVTIDSAAKGIYASNVEISGNGDVKILSNDDGIHAKKNGSYGNVILSGNGKVEIESGGNAVYLENDRYLKLNGQGAPLRFKTTSSEKKAITNGSSSPVAGDNLSEYTSKGAFDSEIVFDRTMLKISDAEFSGTELESDIEAVMGDWRWDAASEELTLNGFDSNHPIFSSRDLTIVLADGTQNKITCDANNAIDTAGRCLIKGNGNLEIVSYSPPGDLFVGIHAADDIDIAANGNVRIDALNYTGIESQTGNIIISGDGSIKVVCSSSNDPAVLLNAADKKLILKGTGAPLSFSALKKAVKNSASSSFQYEDVNNFYNEVSGSVHGAELTFDRTYDLWVGDKCVKQSNKDNILEDAGDPTAVFDPDTKTLTLKNASITSTYSGAFIFNNSDGVDGLIIDIQGGLDLNTSDTDITGINSYKTLTVNGDLTANGVIRGVNVQDIVKLTINGNITVTGAASSWEIPPAAIQSSGDVEINGNLTTKGTAIGIESVNKSVTVGAGDHTLDIDASECAIKAAAGGIIIPSTHSILTPEGGMVRKDAADGLYKITKADGTTAAPHAVIKYTYVPYTGPYNYKYDYNYGITVAGSEHGTADVKKFAEEGTRVSISVIPDTGYTLETLTVTDVLGSAIEVTAEEDGTYSFRMPSCRVEVAATFMDDNFILNMFTDVPADSWFYEPVYWAAKNGITDGTDAARFSPYRLASRAEMVTLLWRAAGEKAVDYVMPFIDLAENAYYTEAVRWAASLGITSGTGADTFSPDDPVTREEAIAMIYNYAKTKGEGFTGDWMFLLDFEDAEEISGWASEGMHWGVMKSIVRGVGENMLAPQLPACRAEIVTMLYRYFVK